MDFVDEQDGVFVLLDFLHHLLQALFEIAAIARAGEQRAHVEREDGRIGQDLRHIRIDDLARKALGDRRFPDARVTNQERIVLLPAAQHLNGALHFGLAANERIDAPLSRLPIEVDAISFQGAFLFL